MTEHNESGARLSRAPLYSMFLFRQRAYCFALLPSLAGGGADCG